MTSIDSIDIALKKQRDIVQRFNDHNWFEKIAKKWQEGFLAHQFRIRSIDKNTENHSEVYTLQQKEECLELYSNFKKNRIANKTEQSGFWLLRPKLKYKKYKFGIKPNEHGYIEHVLQPKNISNFNVSLPLPSHLQQACETHYCLKCHMRNLDTCRTGLPYDETKQGCPLDQKISEMITLAEQGDWIAAIIVAMEDNPFLLLTGYKVCNDCSEACIFQNQTAVDVPAIETQLVHDLLSVKEGLEIYQELFCEGQQYCEKQQHHAIFGSGPAALSLSYYLLKNGHKVTIFEAGVMKPIAHCKQTIDNTLEDRQNDFFGGVMSYGITKRWNKNYLDYFKYLMYKFDNFNIKGSCALGNGVTIQNVIDSGFNAATIAFGCGPAKTYHIKGLDIIPNVYTSSDILMKINLCNNWEELQMSDLEIQMPVVIAGGGLTSIDAATDIKTYYLKQIKYAHDYFASNPQRIKQLSKSNQEQVEKYLQDYQIWINNPDMVHDITPVVVVNRSTIDKSNAYTINHQELKDALAQGIQWIEDSEITEFDQKTIMNKVITFARCKKGNILPCNTFVFAVGTKNNNSFMHSENQYIKTKDGAISIEEDKCTNNIISQHGNFPIYVLGDANSYYKGSVVKALASAKNHYKQIIDQAKKTILPAKIVNKIIDIKFTSLQFINNSNTVLQIDLNITNRHFISGDTIKVNYLQSKSMQQCALTLIKQSQNTAIAFVRKTAASQFLFTLASNNLNLDTTDLNSFLQCAAINATALARHSKAETVSNIYASNKMLVSAIAHASGLPQQVNIYAHESAQDLDVITGTNNKVIYGDITNDIINKCNVFFGNITSVTPSDNDIQYIQHSYSCMFGGVCGNCKIYTKNGSFFSCIQSFTSSKHWQRSQSSNIINFINSHKYK